MSDVKKFIDKIKSNPESIEFENVIKLIDENYVYTPVCFSNGIKNDNVTSDAGENEGSCKIFSFARIHKLDEAQTLHCFGKFYRQDVLQNPNKTDHANIRTFMKYGWNHVAFEKEALSIK